MKTLRARSFRSSFLAVSAFHHRRLVLLTMASVLVLSGCMLSPLFQAPAVVITGLAVLLGLAACSPGGGGGGSDQPPAEQPPAEQPPTEQPPGEQTPVCTFGISGPLVQSAMPPVSRIISTLTVSEGAILTGDPAALGEAAGTALAAGDVNGDGCGDLIVGAPYAIRQEGGMQGRAYVIFANTGLGTISALTLDTLTAAQGFAMQGQSTLAYAGAALAVGQINGDGNADIAIGERHHESYFNSFTSLTEWRGTAWTVFGDSALASSHPSLLAVGASGIAAGTGLQLLDTYLYDGVYLPHNQLGSSITTLDLNGDGIQDLVVGAPAQSVYWTSAFARPRVEVIYGGSALNSSALMNVGLPATAAHKILTIDGNVSGATSLATGFGSFVASAGDFNGDTYPDLLITAPGQGKVFVVFGQASGVNSLPTNMSTLGLPNGFTVTGAYSGSVAELRAVGVGDVNNDGLDDILVMRSPTSFQVIFGSSSLAAPWSGGSVNITSPLSTSHGFTISMPGGFTGVAFAGADLDGDGYSDVIIGSPGAWTFDPDLSYQRYTGAVLVVNGSASPVDVDMGYAGTLDGTHVFAVVGPVDYAYVGQSLTVGDFNGDGYADLAVGSVKYGVSGTNKNGTVYVIFGGGSLNSLSEVAGGDIKNNL